MELRTARLTLREFRADDWPAVMAYQNDPRYLRYNAWDGRRPEEVQAFVGMFLAQQQEQPRTKFQLVVTLTERNELIGNCGIRRPVVGSPEAELGYELAPAHWGQGYASEAARAMVGWGFRELGLHRVFARCVADNTDSARVLQKLGMQLEGRQREKEYFKGRWWDSLLFAVLEHEWQAQGVAPPTLLE